MPPGCTLRCWLQLGIFFNTHATLGMHREALEVRMDHAASTQALDTRHVDLAASAQKIEGIDRSYFDWFFVQTHGTMLDGQPVPKNKPVQVNDGARLTFGNAPATTHLVRCESTGGHAALDVVANESLHDSEACSKQTGFPFMTQELSCFRHRRTCTHSLF